MRHNNHQQEERRAPEITPEDIEQMERNVKEHKAERVGGRLQSPFEMFCVHTGVIKLGEHGETLVVSPTGYHANCAIWAEVEKKRGRVAYAKKKELEELDRMQA